MFTVVIPTYGRAERLKNSILSVLNQTKKCDEIIVIDDNLDQNHSLNTQRIIEEFKNKKIKYIKNVKNMGANYCRNLGLKLSKSKYVAFLDDDDEFYENKLEIISKNLGDDPDLIYSSVELYNEDLNKSNIMFRKEKKIKEKILSYNFIGGSSAVVIKKDFYKKIGGFDEKLPSCQDWDFWAKSIFNNAKIKAIKVPLVKTIVHSSAERITNNLDKRICGHNLLFEKFDKYFDDNMKLDKIKDKQKLVIANLYYDMNKFQNYLEEIKSIKFYHYRFKDFLRIILFLLGLKLDRFKIQQIYDKGKI